MKQCKGKSIQKCMVAASLFAVVLSRNPIVLDAADPAYVSKYKGQERRAIKSLSENDIQELTTGAGWGLAKAAELNGLPGPKHILEMKDEISLTADQEMKIRKLYGEMNKNAIDLGRQFIELERELNDRFAQRSIDERILEGLLSRIAETHKSLRYVHLSAHLQTPHILSDMQIKKYNDLRGYSSSDPCANIPEGHDPVMWRKHNSCD